MLYVFGFKKTNKEISTTGGEIMNLFFQELILQTKFRSKVSVKCQTKFLSRIYFTN